MGYSKHSISMWLELDGKEYDVVQAQYGYAINSIPSASIVLAAGVNLTTLKASAANFLAGNSTDLIPAKLFMRANREFVEGTNSVKLDGDYMVFMGYVALVGAEIRRDGIGIDCALIHWLSDLNHGSCISASSHPANPAQLAFNSTIGDNTGADHFLATTLAQQHFNAFTIGQDLWGKAILPWFKELASKDRIDAAIFGRNDDPDASVVAALDRFDGDILPLNMADLDASEVAEAIYQDISASVLVPNNNHFTAMANTTLWDKLVGDLAATYLFAIIPGPTWAKAVPLIAGLRTPWISKLTGNKFSFNAQEDTACKIQNQLTRPIGGFGLYGNFGAGFGGFNPGDAPMPIEVSIGGTYKAADKGMIILKRNPRWADGVMFPGGMPIGPGTDGKLVACAMEPGVGEAPAKNPQERFRAGKTLADRLAHAFYVDEVLKNRTGTLVTIPRFDVCPGSTVSMQAANTDREDAAYFGTVIKVSYEISADPANIRTIYSLAHIRTKQENEDDRTSIDQHPLYNRKWPGDWLIKPGAGTGGAFPAAAAGGAAAAAPEIIAAGDAGNLNLVQ